MPTYYVLPKWLLKLLFKLGLAKHITDDVKTGTGTSFITTELITLVQD